MKAIDYGKDYQEHLLEQYKLFVTMADNVSARRTLANSFYITVLSALLAILSLAGENFATEAQNMIFLVVSILGLVLCIVWKININSYGQLNTGKFKVIHEMEAQLPFACYDREWEFLGAGQDSKKYLQLTKVEQYVPYLLAIPYLLLLVYALYGLYAF
ncbi:MAG: hypothetical protein JZU65_15045 [Chlorobium sp.]|jgi:hypothetical protein|nr:hypothetical protein [Chlorobium sp.]